MTDLDQVEKFIFDKPGTVREQPFGPEVLVYKLSGKIFALIAWEKSPLTISLKCAPDNALFLRLKYAEVKPGYHLNKKHWNTVTLNGIIPGNVIKEMINESYDLILSTLSKKLRTSIKQA
ncbi:MAG: MmcQ/YjbR family DNA-binding protein [Candidatus Marinimicrobia bacterium]|nr:MmcQ/YjbR family DNA-binding protein [Candidatus Neomarinimicrobiota bacterium]